MHQMSESIHEISLQVSEVKEAVKEIKSLVEYESTKLQVSEQEEHCLALNVYHEAGIEDHAGKVAVAQVTLNRVKNGNWGRSICEVVFAHAQFSWTLPEKMQAKRKAGEDPLSPRGELWERSKKATGEFLNGARVAKLKKSLYYHADYIAPPFWVDMDAKITKVGQHIFYSRALTREQLKQKTS